MFRSVAVLLLVSLAMPAVASATSHTVGNPDFGPYLGKVGTNGITISWRTASPATSRVEYGPTAALGTVVDDLALTQIHEVPLTGLAEGETYFYRVESSVGGTPIFGSSVHTFRTADGDDDVRFVFMAEIHEEAEVGAFSSDVAAFDPDFLTEAGDNVDEGNDLEQWERFFGQGDWWADVPLFHAHGNHNYSSVPGVPQGGPALATRELLALPDVGGSGSEHWYSVRFGNVLLLALDSTFYFYEPATLDQIPWLEAELQAATDGEDDPTYIVAFFHIPPFSSCGECWYRNFVERPWVRNNLVSLFEQYGVDLVLNGHDKIYEWSCKSGVQYVQVTSGASPRDDDGQFWNAFRLDSDDNSLHMVQVSASASDMRVEIVREDGALVNAFTIPAGGAPCPPTGGCSLSAVNTPTDFESNAAWLAAPLAGLALVRSRARRSCVRMERQTARE